MKSLMSTGLRVFFQVLILVSALGMCSFVFADTTLELEYGYEALEEYKTYQLDPAYDYSDYDTAIISIDDDGLVRAIDFGDTYITVSKSGEYVETIEVIVYLVGDEPVPWASVLVEHAYVSGYPDGTFKPAQYITRAEVAVMFSRVLNLSWEGALTYQDLTREHWAYPFIQNVTGQGLMLPRSPDAFYPKAYITRGELAGLIANYAAYQGISMDGEPKTVIQDVTLMDPDFTHIHKVVNARLLTVTDQVFKPQDFIMRGEVVRIINQMVARSANAIEKNDYRDLHMTDEYYFDILKASYETP